MSYGDIATPTPRVAEIAIVAQTFPSYKKMLIFILVNRDYPF
jgi:hypothetical protein